MVKAWCNAVLLGFTAVWFFRVFLGVSSSERGFFALYILGVLTAMYAHAVYLKVKKTTHLYNPRVY